MGKRKESVIGRRHHVALVLALGILLLMIGTRAAAQVEMQQC
jgi:hypothetical protein